MLYSARHLLIQPESPSDFSQYSQCGDVAEAARHMVAPSPDSPALKGHCHRDVALDADMHSSFRETGAYSH
eukprot:COSAG01_NODE_2741_length_7157_cov_10.590677_1_plen_71_part_00